MAYYSLNNLIHDLVSELKLLMTYRKMVQNQYSESPLQSFFDNAGASATERVRYLFKGALAARWEVLGWESVAWLLVDGCWVDGAVVSSASVGENVAGGC